VTGPKEVFVILERYRVLRGDFEEEQSRSREWVVGIYVFL